MLPSHKELPQRDITPAHRSLQASEDPELDRRPLSATRGLSSTSVNTYGAKRGCSALCCVWHVFSKCEDAVSAFLRVRKDYAHDHKP